MLGRYVNRAVDAQSRWSKPFGDFNHRWLSALFHPIRPIQNFLNGTWLGHPVHAALTDVPIGALTVSIVADLIGQHVVADVSMLVGVLAMVAAAVTGLADYTEVDGTARNRATVHATVMVITLVLYTVSLLIRSGNPPDRLPVANVGERDGEITSLASESLTKLEEPILVHIESDQLRGLTFGHLPYEL